MRIHRTQALVLGFGVAAWLGLVAILIAAPDALRGPLTPSAWNSRVTQLAFLVAVTALMAYLGVGVVRRRRWMFWVILVAFLAGVLRAPASALELLGVLPMSAPAWFVSVQAGVGLVQFIIGLAMLSGLPGTGAWGPFQARAWRRAHLRTTWRRRSG